MNILKEKAITVINHQFYRSILLFASIFACLVVVMPNGFFAAEGLRSFQRLIKGEIGQSSQKYQFETLTKLESEQSDEIYDYYLGENNGHVTLIKTYVGELNPVKQSVGKKSTLVKNIGGITESVAGQMEKPKLALLGKAMNKVGSATEKYALSIRGYVAAGDSAFASEFDQMLLDEIRQDRMIVSPKMYYIPDIFWLLPITLLLFVIDMAYLMIRRINIDSYIISRMDRYNVGLNYQAVERAFDENSMHQAISLPEGLLTKDYLLIEKYAKFYLIALSEILIFSEKTGEILIKKRKFPIRLGLSQSSIHQIQQFLHMNYPNVIIDHEKIKPYRESHQAKHESLWAMIGKSLLSELGVLVGMFIIVTLFIVPGVSFSTFIVVLIIVTILGALGF